MPIVTVEQVRDYLSHPSWSDAQRRACAQLIKARQARLQDWLRVPIDPVERTDMARVITGGLVATTYPIHTLLGINGVAVTEGVPPAPYELRDGWLYDTSYAQGVAAYSTRSFSLLAGANEPPQVSVHYMAGWGSKDDLVGAIIDKVAAVMLNRHDDTVVARNLDAEAPKSLNEDWTEDELKMLRARRRPVGARL
jgi:hypothetical protein